MSLWFLSSPEATTAFLIGRAERSREASRLAYLAIDGLARLGDAVAHTTRDLGARAIAALVRGHRRRAAIAELSALDSRTLADIGLSRSDISSVVEELLGNAPRTRIRTLPRRAPAPARAATPAAAHNENTPARAA